MRILIVEDNKEELEYIINIAKHANPKIDIFSTDSVVEALNIAKENDIKAFFIDIELADGDGIELAANIRNIKKYEFAQIVFITAVISRELEAFHGVHCYDFIIKSISNDKLKQTMEKILINYLNKETISSKEREENKFLNLEFKNVNYRIDLNEIIYIEYESRRIVIQTKHERIKYKFMGLKKFIKVLPCDFVQVHQSIVINKNYIKNIDMSKQKIHLKGSDILLDYGRTYKEIAEGLINELI